MGNNPSWFSKQGDGKRQRVQGLDTSRFPVETSFSWDDCQDFPENAEQQSHHADCIWHREIQAKPHEDQWEYACRGGKGNKQAFYFGDEPERRLQANCV